MVHVIEGLYGIFWRVYGMILNKKEMGTIVIYIQELKKLHLDLRWLHGHSYFNGSLAKIADATNFFTGIHLFKFLF